MTSRYFTKLLATVIVLSAAVAAFAAQNADNGSNQESVVLTNLFQPVYPPLAKQTRITGDVELALEVKADGSLESAVVVSGHPLLKQAALDSAQRSQFACRNCGEGVRSFQMSYSFQLGPTRYCTEVSSVTKSDEKQESYPRVIQSQNHITLVDQPVGTCDLAFTVTYKRVRSAKCLYLWRCGSASTDDNSR
jgi:TonB family protein